MKTFSMEIRASNTNQPCIIKGQRLRTFRQILTNHTDDQSEESAFVGADENPLHFYNYDNPKMVLVSVPLTENNFLSYSKAIKIALEAKAKVRFINGFRKPAPEKASEYNSWRRAYCMVFSWLLNSISKEIVESMQNLLEIYGLK